MEQHWVFFINFFSNDILKKKIVDQSLLQTQIIGVEGEQTDHQAEGNTHSFKGISLKMIVSEVYLEFKTLEILCFASFAFYCVLFS